MGCLESSAMPEATFEFKRDKHGNGGVFADKDDEEVITLEHGEILEGNNPDDLVVTTVRNDIRRIVKEEIAAKSSNISKAAVHKLIANRKNDKEVKKIKFDGEAHLKS